MFDKRAIRVSLEDKEAGAGEPPGPNFEEKTTIIVKAIEELAFKAAIGFGAYILLDTCRQVMIAKANNP